MNDKIKTLMIDMFNRGYAAGHHDTVEGVYVDIHWQDHMTYHEDVVMEMVDEMREAGQHAELLSDNGKDETQHDG